VKWPNDVLVAGRKVSGVLCEAVGDAVVIGIGINLRPGALSPELAATAVALDEVTESPVDRAALAGRVVAELHELLTPGPLELLGALGREMSERDVLNGRSVAAAVGDVGVARGIERDGALRVEVAPGDVRRVVAGGVRIRD